MSKYKESRLKQIEEEHQRRVKRRRWLALIGAVLGLTAGAGIWHHNASASKEASAVTRSLADQKWTLAALLALKPHQLEGMDIAVTNLLCAEGLHGSENLDVDKSLDRLDEMASRVRLETDRNMHRFRSNPAEYENSEACFRMAMPVTVLQQDFGLRYNPDRVTPVGVFEPNDKFFADSHDVLIHCFGSKKKRSGYDPIPPRRHVSVRLNPLRVAYPARRRKA